jgi:hypothetical protein
VAKAGRFERVGIGQAVEHDAGVIESRRQFLLVRLVGRVVPLQPEVLDQPVEVGAFGILDEPEPFLGIYGPAEELAERVPDAPAVARQQT